MVLTIALSAVAALACVIGYSVLLQSQVRGILHDSQLWETGGQTLPAQYEGSLTTRQFIFKSYDLTVTYQTPDGLLHQRKLEVETLGSDLPDAANPSVRVSRTDPEDFALDVAVEASGARWVAAAAYFFLGWACWGEPSPSSATPPGVACGPSETPPRGVGSNSAHW